MAKMHVMKSKKPVNAAKAFKPKRCASTAAVVVNVDPALGPKGEALAAAVSPLVSQSAANLAQLFGVAAPQFTLNIVPLSTNADGTGGAYHMTCADAVLNCDADVVSGNGPQRTAALFVAEAVEVCEAVLAKGWDCGSTNGEGLSRVLASALYPGALDDYSTAGEWLDGGRPNWIDHNEPTDTDNLSNGCAALFLNWLNVCGGFSWSEIVAAGAPTLAGTYETLTGKASAWADFSAACQVNWPQGSPSGVGTDNPWDAVQPPPIPPTPTPTPTPTPHAISTVTLSGQDAAGTYALIPLSPQMREWMAKASITPAQWLTFIAQLFVLAGSIFGAGSTPPKK